MGWRIVRTTKAGPLPEEDAVQAWFVHACSDAGAKHRTRVVITGRRAAFAPREIPLPLHIAEAVATAGRSALAPFLEDAVLPARIELTETESIPSYG